MERSTIGMVLLEVGCLAIGALSLRREYLNKKKIRSDHEAADTRIHKSEGHLPCPRCDASTLRYLNSLSYRDSCVIVDTVIPGCCERCAPTCCVPVKPVQDIEKMVNVLTTPEIKVKVQMPVRVFGSIQRAFEASAVASKGSDLRAHGSFVSLLSMEKGDEYSSIAMLKWYPYLMMQHFRGKASLTIPDAFTGYPTQSGLLRPEEYADYTKMPKRETVSPGAPGIMRRLRKLRNDEKLSEEARRLMRKGKKEATAEIGKMITRYSSTDIFTLKLVEIKPNDKLEYGLDTIPEFDSECSSDSEQSIPSSCQSSPRSAVVDPDADESSDNDMPALEPIEQAIDQEQEGRLGDNENESDVLVYPISRTMLLSLRSNAVEDLGYTVAVPRKARRAWRRKQA